MPQLNPAEMRQHLYDLHSLHPSLIAAYAQPSHYLHEAARHLLRCYAILLLSSDEHTRRSYAAARAAFVRLSQEQS